MRIIDYTLKLLGITEIMRRWQSVIAEVDDRRRDRIARYADEIAATLARATEAIEKLERDPADRIAARTVRREFGRLGGYIENIITALQGHIDGRRLQGVKRRLESLAADGLVASTLNSSDPKRLERLAAAEGYFRALADGLRA